MARNIVIEQARSVPPSQLEVEMVERKGLGHPDTLADGIVEEISRTLCKEYVREFGRILHHNVDKGQICAGGSEPVFNGGKITKPIYILLSGRATFEAQGKRIAVEEIATGAAKNYLKRTVRNIDVETGVDFNFRVSPGAKDLVELFLRGPKVPFANDTSLGSGFAPFSDVERLVLSLEDFLNSPKYKKLHPEVGEDIKVMGTRVGKQVQVSVAVAFVSKHVSSLKDYIEKKAALKSDIEKFAEKTVGRKAEIFLNTADDEKKGSVYLTVTGTSAEMGDDGAVGRGNRVNGLITPLRHMVLEAAAGKNPVSHTGKIYSIAATQIAELIVKENPDVSNASVLLLSQIGKPIDQPRIASVSLAYEGAFEKIEPRIRSTVDHSLENITEITNKIVEGKVRVF